MKKETLKKLQNYELNMLKKVDDFCRNNNILYSLYAGTALGAVRHKGFIPWDDDIDIVMTRNEFNKFYNIWIKNPIDGFFLQSLDNEPNYSLNHFKIRDCSSKMCTYDYEENLSNNGIWIDIFVFEKVKDNIFSKIMMYTYAYTRTFISRGNSEIIYDDGKIKKILKKFVKIIPQNIRNKIVKILDKKISKFNNLSKKFSYVDFSTPTCFNIKFPLSITNEYIDIDFCGNKFMIFKDYDLLLKLEYGNYMKLPDKQDRICKHNPKILEFY